MDYTLYPDTYSVHQLRVRGNKVKVEHKRRYFDPVNKRYVFLTDYERSLSALPPYVEVEATGGVTFVTITLKRSGNELVGTAVCSNKENYCRKTGVALAIERALNGKL